MYYKDLGGGGENKITVAVDSVTWDLARHGIVGRHASQETPKVEFVPLDRRRNKQKMSSSPSWVQKIARDIECCKRQTLSVGKRT